MLKDARVNIKRMGLEDKIKILEGDAADILPTLEGPYDVIFMDAAKGQYQAFLPHCLRLLPIGGLLIVDDVLQGGTIAQTRFSVPRRQRTIHKRLRNFLWEITHHDALETSIIPIGDGVALCYKKKEIIPETKTEGKPKCRIKRKWSYWHLRAIWKKLKIAVLYGADAVYIGGEAYGLRAKAKNF